MERVPRPLDITICPTLRCEVTCNYCCLRSAKMRPLTELDTTKWLAFLKDISQWGIRSLAISGGDFFSRADSLVLLATIKKLGLKLRKPISTKTPLGEAMLVQLRKIVGEIQFSLDTLDVYQLSMLLTSASDDSSTYLATMMNTIAMAVDLHFNVTVRATLTRTTVDFLDAFIDTVLGLGVGRIVLAPYIDPLPRLSSLALSVPSEAFSQFVLRYRAMIPHRIQFKLPGGDGTISSADDAARVFYRDAKAFVANCICRGNRETATVLPDGNVGYCAMMANTQGPYLGNIENSSLQTIWLSARARRMAFLTPHQFTHSPCSQCQRLTACIATSSRCYYRIVEAYGKDKLHQADPRCPNATEIDS